MTARTPEKDAVESQLKILARAMYSNPPLFGARVVQTILDDPALEAQWRKECAGMADRIARMRTLLRSGLEERQPGGAPAPLATRSVRARRPLLSPRVAAHCSGLVAHHGPDRHVHLHWVGGGTGAEALAAGGGLVGGGCSIFAHHLAQVKRLVHEHSIYMTSNGRISMAGLNSKNVEYVVDCIDKVTAAK